MTRDTPIRGSKKDGSCDEVRLTLGNWIGLYTLAAFILLPGFGGALVVWQKQAVLEQRIESEAKGTVEWRSGIKEDLRDLQQAVRSK